MSEITNMFSVYIIIVMLGIGLYMVFVQSSNLADIVNMKKEGNFVKFAGWFYIVLGIIGVIITAL